MRIAITSQNLDPKIVVSGISTVARTIISLSKETFFLYEVGYRDGDKKNASWFFKQIAMLLNFKPFLKTNNIDIVHLNIPFDTMGIIRDYLLFRLAKSSGKKVLAHIHGGKLLMIPTKSKVVRFFINHLLKSSDKVLVLSDIEKEILIKNYSFTEADFLENAVDTSSINFKDTRPANQQQPTTILYLARITESKGIDDIVDAMKYLAAAGKKFKFILCGSGAEADKYAAIFNNILKDTFDYKGVVSGQDKWDTIYQSDIFVLPSRHSEGLPMSLLETMAAGLVPVVTDEASMIKVVKHAQNGLVVNKYDGADLAQNLLRLIDDHALLKSYSVTARESIIKNYDTSVYINKLEHLYSTM